jgi:cathepsin L
MGTFSGEFMKDVRQRTLLSSLLTLMVFGYSAAFAQEQKPIQPKSLENMQRVLNQKEINYAEREKTAPPEIKLKLQKLRSSLPFNVGYTAALDLSIEQLAGTRIPRDIPQSAIATINARGLELRGIDIRSASEAHIKLPPASCSASASSFDWRKLGKVTPIKTQICGTCWDFTSMGAYEGSYAVRNDRLIDGSEQYILNCAHAGSCQGGWWMPVFDFLIKTGTAAESDDPFTGNDGAACASSAKTPYRASAWGFVASNLQTIPQPAQIKQALCEHGPLATAVMVDEGFQAYTGPQPFDEHTQHFDWVNHGITIVGWDDKKGSWLIKNSWGTSWGDTGGFGTERGYMWIKYNTNNVGIATAWVDAAPVRYVLRPDWLKTLEKYRLTEVKPLPTPLPHLNEKMNEIKK